MEWPGEEGVQLQTNRAWGQLFTELVPHCHCHLGVAPNAPRNPTAEAIDD